MDNLLVWYMNKAVLKNVSGTQPSMAEAGLPARVNGSKSPGPDVAVLTNSR